jgi:hypothetical protein
MKALCIDGPHKGEWHEVPDGARIGHAVRIAQFPRTMSDGHLPTYTTYMLREDGKLWSAK